MTLTLTYETIPAFDTLVTITVRRGDLALLSDALEVLAETDGSWFFDHGDLKAFQARVERLREHIDEVAVKSHKDET